MIRAILFDLDGTLVDRDGALRRYGLDLAARHPEIFPPETLDRDLRVLLAAPDRDRRRFAHRVARAFPALGPPAALAGDVAARLPSFLEPEAEVIRLIDRLRNRYRVGIVTNGSGPSQRAKLAAAGLSGLIDGVFISGVERAAKPHAAIFRRALAWAGAEPAEALFVGDDPATDVAGASRIGMRTCWVRRGRDYPDGLPRPDATIETLLELPEVLP
ncbi:Pyrimidine 5'-nucleotidase YjjG [Aquisphaera giovannonii]|uniref:Pyrimidine 5'-nucleotidase YjjG n=1 Tax=Aquisphaera giovannonii TaxID=406548 RepID=A0A5B9VXU6_9BACT|nr:HAD family hydrolase [Aquisphaera giovannonii]QEH32440.1 Pyrimidine 5'-nucleotidase YjjG [Aquisphaera giovannonii]